MSMFKMRDIKEENFGNVGWKPIPSRFSKEEIDDAYAAEALRRKEMIAAKQVLKNAVVDEGGKALLSSILPPSLPASLARICSFFEKDEQAAIREEVTMGVASASVNLAQWQLVPGAPPVFNREPILEKERRIDLEYTIGQLPKLKVPEDYTNSAEAFYHFSHESVTEFREVMDLQCARYGLPSIALNSDMLPCPFSPDFFLSNPGTLNSSHANVIEERITRYLKAVPSGANLWCLWGGAGKMVIQCAKYLRPDVAVTFIGTADYPLTLYDQYLGYVASERNVDRFVRHDYTCNMRDFVNANDFSQVCVIANYVPCFDKPARMVLQISLDRGQRLLPGKEMKAVRYVPAAMDYTDVADYFNMFVFRNDKERKNTRLYDPVADVYFSYDHHRVWADQLCSTPGVLLSELMLASGNPSYKGNLKIFVQGDKGPFVFGPSRECEPLSVSYLSIEPSKMMFFEADKLAYVDYCGPLTGTNRVVSSVMLIALVKSDWYLVDCDVGNRFALRYLDVASSSFPSVSMTMGGSFAIPWSAYDIFGVVRIKYSDPDVYDETGLNLNRQVFRGLANSGGDIVFDGFSEFHYTPETFYSHVKSDSKLSWKVRFARGRDNVCEGFHLQVLHDDLQGEEFVLAHIPLLGLPPDISDKIILLCADYVEGFSSV